MNGRMTDERFHELCAGYVLATLEDDERPAFLQELHRRGDDGLRALARVEEVLGHVALDAAPVEPPAELREALFADLGIRSLEPERGDAGAGPGRAEGAGPEGGTGAGREEPATARHPGERPPPGSQEIPSRPAEPPPTAAEEPAEPRSRGGGRGFWMAAAAVLFLVAAGLAAWALLLEERLVERAAALAETRAELAAADSVRASLGERLDSARTDFRVLASPALQTLSLEGTATLPAARARIYMDPETGRALILADELPILPPASVYQLWAIRGRTPVSVGTFRVEDPGPARMPMDDPSVLYGADALAVTVEPAPGQPRPTGDMVLRSVL